MSQILEWVGVVTGSGLAGSALTGLFARRKNKADTAKVFVDAAAVLVDPLRHEISDLRDRVGALEEENTTVRSKLRRALGHIKDLYAWIYVHAPSKTPPALPREFDVMVKEPAYDWSRSL